MGDSATRIFQHWPQLWSRYQEQSYKCEAYYNRHTGQSVLGPSPLKETTGRPMVRRDLMGMLEEAVARQEIPIHFNQKIVDYFESDDHGVVELLNGNRISADVVAACDGIHSASWRLTSGKKPNPMSSGSAVYRTSVPAALIFQKDPNLKEQFALREGKPYLKWFSGPGTHGLVFANKDTICWSVHHPVSLKINTEYGL